MSWSLHAANRVVDIRPLVRLAARFAGPGPNRLKIVKLSHALGDDTARRRHLAFGEGGA